MGLPYKISTLLYAFNEKGQVLLLERKKEPNRGLWSPCGGKLKTDIGESPYACACREAKEELGLELTPADLHLTGIVSEDGYEGTAHWLMFLFEIKPRLTKLPPPISEGNFGFFYPEELKKLPLPRTDAEMIWDLFWKHRGGFFSAHCKCLGNDKYEWTIEESIALDNISSIDRLDLEQMSKSDSIASQQKESSTAESPVIDLHSHHYFMGEALKQAAKAAEIGEVPVGAVIVRNGRIIARAHNQVELLKDATAHAEILALTQAQSVVGDWRLTDCILYVTKEPCPMCAGAIVHTRLAEVIYGAPDPKGGAAGSVLNLLQFPTLNHRCPVTGGVRQEECRFLLRTFFLDKRGKSTSTD